MPKSRFLRVFVVLMFSWLTAGGLCAEENSDELEQGLRDMAQDLAQQMAARDVKKLAIINFEDLSGYESALGLFLAEELTTLLLQSDPGGFDIVERQQLSKVLEEQSLTSSALFDADTIGDVGAILGIQGIITGTTADLGSNIKINARCISVETALVFAAASAKVPKAGVVDSLMRQGAGPGSGGVGPAAGSGKHRVQASDVFFQNSFLRLTVASLGLSEDKKTATLSLILENLINENLELGIEMAGRLQVHLVDDRGTSRGLHTTDYSGIAHVHSSSRSEQQFSQFSPKSRSVIVMTFESRDPFAGDVFSIGMGLVRQENAQLRRFSAGISNIRPSH